MLFKSMTPIERRGVSSLAAIMSLRMLGLFMILPVFALYAHDLALSTPLLLGIAMGIYGLTQAILQIPFGMLSDHIGRKPIIILGLSIFILGSIVAANSHSIYMMILGRALQGGGAIGSTIIATIADLTREEQRTKAMAINGITIGLSFSVAMILGPLFSNWISVSGIFWLAAGFGLLGIILLLTVTPTPEKTSWHSDAEAEPAQFFTIMKEPQLARLNIGVLILHAIFTASFVVIPISLQKYAGYAAKQQWAIYIPALVIAFIASLAMIGIAESKQQVKKFFLTGIIILCVSELVLFIWAHSVNMSVFGLFLFFTAFSLLEAFLPSWVSRAAPKARKGTALGIYSCSQFLGIFVGGSVGGFLYGALGLVYVYLFCVGLALLWLAIAIGMKNPQHSTRLNNSQSQSPQREQTI
jgi:predicted MFS family arabinose efflux permease